MAVARTPFDVRRQVSQPLSPVEQAVLDICQRAAAEGRQLDSIEDMRMELGALSYSTVPGVMKRLEEKGYITREIYQRGRRVCITATGQCTVPPSCTAPHWRNRTENVPSPAIQAVREKSQSLSSWLEAKARREGKSIADMLMDCVYAGANALRAEEEEGE